VSGLVHEEDAEGSGGASAIRELRAELRRHLEWLRDAGLAEVEISAKRSTPSSREQRPPGGEPPSPEVAPVGPYSLADKGCASAALLEVRGELGECSRCKLAGGRTNLVFGVGRPDAELLFVGEGPGADEDAQGEPFVGKAGQLLTRMIEAMGLRREDVYIANVVKCRPPGNRDPEPDEIAACEPFLKAQIAALSPRIIVALGRFAVQTLLRDTTPITRQRGRWREYEGVKLMPTFHPAYLFRNPGEKKKAWEDLKLVMKELPGKGGAPGPGSGSGGGEGP
jgi:DNA polymerase